MVFWILMGLGLYVVNVYLAGAMLFLRIGPTAYMGPRDTLPDPSKFYARAQKSVANFAESLPVFLTLGILALVVEGVDMAGAELGAMIFVLLRMLYIAVYISGVPFIRSLVYSAGHVGLILMLLALL